MSLWAALFPPLLCTSPFLFFSVICRTSCDIIFFCMISLTITKLFELSLHISQREQQCFYWILTQRAILGYSLKLEFILLMSQFTNDSLVWWDEVIELRSGKVSFLNLDLIASTMLTMTNLIIILIPPLLRSIQHQPCHLSLLSSVFSHISLSIHLLALSSTSCSSKSRASLFRGAPPLNLGTHSTLPTEMCVCVCARCGPRGGGGSLCSPQLKGRGITGTQTLIKAFQPPMAPLIQS